MSKTVIPESFNWLVASAADDSSIIGVCGETKLINEEGSWWTVIQVYEHYISSPVQGGESLFGSVPCPRLLSRSIASRRPTRGSR